MSPERRSSPRIPLQVWATSTGDGEARRWLGDEVVPPDFAFCYTTRDLGEGGVFLESEDPLAEGSTLKLELRLPSVREPLRLKARVSRVVPRGDPARRVPGMGVEFVELTPADRGLLREFVSEAHRT